MRIFFKIAFIFVLLTGNAHAEKRALTIGVDRYESLPILQKATGDAQALAEQLRASGYQATQLSDVGREAFLQEWSIFLQQIRPGDEVAFFFAGHGMEIDGLNYVLAADAPTAEPGEHGERFIRDSAIEVRLLLAELRERKPLISLVILDACRNNPYAAKGRRGIGGTRGLARMEPPEGAFVMYSAGVGEEALDRLSDADREPVSVYMRHLLPLLRAPRLRIQDVALQVRDDVRAVAAQVRHAQNPAYYDELRGAFCFAGCAASAATKVLAVNGAPKPVSQAPVPNECLSENPKLYCFFKER